jgi:LacI family transcriptional regulator
MATIKEVAKLAKVSVGTVSNVLSDSPRVSAVVRERVNTAIAALDYHPNHIARSLKTRQTKLLGMVLSDITNPFFPQLTRGAEDAALKHGYLLVASNTDDQFEREKIVLSVLRNRRVDGILLVVAPSAEGSEHIERTVASGIPIVFLDRVPPGVRASSVAVDAVYGTEICIRHLTALGHRKIGIITGNLQLRTAADRLQGYKNVLCEAGIELDPSLVMEGDFRMESGYLLTKQLLLGRLRPSALFVSNCMMALGSLRALKEMGLRCPEDLALAVFDELPGNGSFYPEVTTIVQPAYQVGYRGAELLIQQIEGAAENQATELLLKPELRIRESTGLRSQVRHDSLQDRFTDQDKTSRIAGEYGGDKRSGSRRRSAKLTPYKNAP